MEPEDVTFQFLREITDNFSEERKIGEGSFGVVYRGTTKAREDVAVKLLNDKVNIDVGNKQFHNEFHNLVILKHQNIVQVLGYCYETELNPMEINGKKELVEEMHRAICLEYLKNGSLEKHLSDEFSGLDWHTRLKIMKGTCEGLKYIHEELEEPIYHLDLKPDNILLDKDMVPKIADFGLSRIYGKELTRITQNPYGTFGYQPPEYIDRGEISEKFDIFSLGVVMIRIVSGPKGYPKCIEMSSDEFIDQVRRNWRNRLQATCSSNSTLQVYCHQVETCTQIALDCVAKDSHKRPNIVQITEKLNGFEDGIGKIPQKICPKIAGMTMHNKKMRKALEDVTGGRQKNINLVTSPNCSEPEFVDAREASSDVVEGLIVGRAEEKGKIIASLLGGISKEITILPIYGIGGIGKTTFARLVYNDLEFRCYFKVWVHVSQRFDLNKIRESIISQLSAEESLANERQMIHCLTELLSGKKILIVLDDLWEDDQFKLHELKHMLYHGHSNIIILVTTRSERVAERICTNIQPYKIQLLTNDLCWNIIKQRSGFEARDDKEQLMGIGWEIAKKCGGVALAARSFGFTLRSMNFDRWMEVKENNIWDLQDHVLASLKLSYSYMPSFLKLCFAYCAIFPKGHKIVKSKLVYQWISLDFIKPTKMLSAMQLCENYIMQLLGLSFFQHSVSPKTTVPHHEDVTVFIMHDLVHDLAELVMVDEILNGSKQDNNNTGGSKVHFELPNDCTQSLKAFTQYPIKTRALRVLQTDKTGLYMSFLVSGRIGHHDDIFWSAKHLRVLDLSECSIQKLPNSIGNLKQLTYLNAPRVQHRVIPNCITKLSKLIYLGLSGSSKILALPKSIGEMEGLMYLDLSGCSSLKRLPESFGQLTKLVHLDVSKCSHVTNVSEFLENLTNLEHLNLSYCSSIGKLPEHLGYLRQLRNLNLSYSSYLEGHPNAEVFVMLTKLERLNLSSKRSFLQNLLEALSKLTSLKYLNLSGLQNLTNLVHLDLSQYYGASNGILETLGSLTKLQYLNFSNSSWSGKGDKLGPAYMLKAMGNLTELRYLNLSNCSDYLEGEVFFMLLECIGNLPNLEHLDLSGNGNLTSLPDCLCNLRKLQTLDLSRCIQLKGLPENLDEMDSLKFLVLEDCLLDTIYELSRFSKSLAILPDFVVQADCHDSSSSLVRLQDVNRTDLMISKLENVKSAQEARSIKLTEKVTMKKLELNWTENAERTVQDMEVFGELVPPITLEELQISGYNSVRFPKWFVGNIASHLPNLVRISMSNLSMCSSLPPFGQLPNLEELNLERMDSISKIDWEICGTTTRPSFPRLQHFTLYDMGSLEVWYTNKYPRDGGGARQFMFPNLRALKINYCPNLRLEPCPHIAEERWEIWESDGVISSWGEGASQTSVSSPSSAPVSTMHIRNCNVPMHQWRLLHHLPALTKLKIDGCCDLSISPEVTQALSSLQSLTLQSWEKPDPELPNWLGQLPSLKKLKIQGRVVTKALQDSVGYLTRLQSLCLKIIISMTALPQWVGVLISLKQLEIASCHNLNDLTDSIGGLTSLRTLTIRFCSGITSLPESIGGLTSLKELAISYCGGITSLPRSMQKLIKLEKLTIFDCKELRKWCETEENKRKLAHIKRKGIY
ncbi:unnamed protein product [Urochloa decumbens]|uniref:Protein kinase domain-containing protein n=1 Tax=Urochloa decumbens TaxID=240449 RepID=A0ABC9B581_9POAL